MVLLLISVLLSFVFLFAGLSFLYRLQIKEYEFYRYRSFLQDEGWKYLLIPKEWRLPALKSPRNIIVMIILLLVICVTWVFLRESSWIFFLITPIANLIVMFGVAATAPLSFFTRSRYIVRAKERLDQVNPKLVVITGSYGKSSVKEFLTFVLEKKFRVAKTIKNYNTDVGVALSIIKAMQDDTEVFIAELGADRVSGVQNSLAYLAPADFAIVTGIGNQHVGTFGSMTNLVNEKFSVLRALKENGSGYLNDYSDFKEHFLPHPANVALYSEITHGVKIPDGLLDHTKMNLLPVIAIALKLGMTEAEIEERINHLPELDSKLSSYIAEGGALVIEDNYNSNREGFKAAALFLKNSGKQINYIVTPGIIELGIARDATFDQILLYVKSLKIPNLEILTTNKRLAEIGIERGLKMQFYRSENVLNTALSSMNLDSQYGVLLEGRLNVKI